MTAEQIPWFYYIMYSGSLGLMMLGMLAVVMSQHIVRIILGLGLLDGGINLLLIIIGYSANGVAPILVEGKLPAGNMVDPIPQALVLTAIVIGVSVQALALALGIKAYQAYNTFDTQELAQRIAEQSGTQIIDGSPVHLPPPQPTLQLEEITR
jgi:multicomponent Na+:H+ antiporter subunit C